MNVLIFGCGSKFGASLHGLLEQQGHLIWGVTGQKSQSDQILKVDWSTCDIADFERFLKNIPDLDLIIFNQNSQGVQDNQWKFNNDNILEIWKNAKTWKQNHYVNCIMPTHVLQTLHMCGKIHDHTRMVWMLSLSMFGHPETPPDYMGQKYQNFMTLQRLAQHNPGIFLGISPGHLKPDLYEDRAELMLDLIDQTSDADSGQLFVFDDSEKKFLRYAIAQSDKM